MGEVWRLASAVLFPASFFLHLCREDRFPSEVHMHMPPCDVTPLNSKRTKSNVYVWITVFY